MKGLAAMHQRHGKLPWDRLFNESITIAQEGWKVNAVLSSRIHVSLQSIESDPATNDLECEHRDSWRCDTLFCFRTKRETSC